MKTSLLLLALLSYDKPKLYILGDGEKQSKMLQAELERDWTTKPRPSVWVWSNLSEDEQQSFLENGKRLNKISKHIHDKFEIIYVKWPYAHAKEYPAIKIGRGLYEPVDKRAFLTTSYPLLTMQYICDAYFEDDYLVKHAEERHEKILIQLKQKRKKLMEIAKDIKQTHNGLTYEFKLEIKEVKYSKEYPEGYTRCRFSNRNNATTTKDFALLPYRASRIYGNVKSVAIKGDDIRKLKFLSIPSEKAELPELDMTFCPPKPHPPWSQKLPCCKSFKKF